ncbi:MAG TPA: carboxymuconolactone decarboxylase family protein [Dehalococcoidia bacterium]|nr:carboxymuconolactone decarboxylase family protein [Dehalococcoidia bacterium]
MTTQRQGAPWTQVFPKLWDATNTWLFGDIWERPGLSKRDRSMCNIAMLTALYRTDQLRQHLNRGIDNGLTKDEIVEVITHATFYAGWPTGVNAAAVATEVFQERGLL